MLAAVSNLVIGSITTLTASALSVGCVNRTKLVIVPDSPMLIVEASGVIRVAVEDQTTGRMVEVDEEFDAASFEGWTLTKYDWSRK